MANFGNYDIPLFEDDIQTIKEFFRIALNTIVFHRWLGESKFEDTESIFSNITYVKIKNESLQKTIEFNVSQLEKSILKSNRVQVSLKFYQKKIQKFYIMQELTNLWEKWEFRRCLHREGWILASLLLCICPRQKYLCRS